MTQRMLLVVSRENARRFEDLVQKVQDSMAKTPGQSAKTRLPGRPFKPVVLDPEGEDWRTSSYYKNTPEGVAAYQQAVDKNIVFSKALCPYMQKSYEEYLNATRAKGQFTSKARSTSITQCRDVTLGMLLDIASKALEEELED